MELRIYNQDMMLEGICEAPSSLLWTRKYFEAGNFQVTCPTTSNNLKLLKRGNLVWLQGKKEAGVIEWLDASESAKNNKFIAKGKFLETYMDRRLIRPFYSASNKHVEVCMREILSGAEPIPRVQLGELKGFTYRISFQATYKNLLTYETKLAQSAGLGFRFVPDFTNKVITFEVYQGKDRTFNQTENNRVVFSEGFNNISSAKYTENDQKYKNICYVGGRGEGSEREFVIAGDDTLTGLNRREMFLSATDIVDEEMTEEEYRAALLQRGYDALEKNNLVVSFDCETSANGNFKYLTDYDLGDIVSIRKQNWGISTNQRLTEVTEVYEKGAMKVAPTFGSALPASIDWEDD